MASLVRVTLLSSVLLACACKGVQEEAPVELGDLGLYLFSTFDGTDEELLLAGPEIEALIMGYDLDAGINDRAFTMPQLPFDKLGEITHPETDPDLQVPVAVVARSRHDLDAHIETVSEPNRVCLAANTTKYQARTFTTDVDCFVQGSCGRVDTTNEVRKESPLAKIWMDERTDFRRLTMEDGRDVMFSRGWTEKVFLNDSGSKSWDQNYALDIFIEDGTSTLRMYVLWSSATLGVGDDMWSGLVKGGIDEYLGNVDDFIDGDMCSVDRDRAYDRE